MSGRVFDVAVVGAGPAGAAAALAARRAGASVLLLDRADFPRDKPCGDGIAADAVEVLAGLGVTGVTAGYPPVTGLRLVAPGGTEVVRPLPRPAFTVPRRVFDARLVTAAAEAGAEVHRHTVRRVEPADSAEVRGRRVDHADEAEARRYTVRRAQAGAGVVLDGTWRARVLIGADGATSVVRRALGHPVNPAGHLAIAIRGYAAAHGTEQLIRTTGARWPAYAWSFPIGDGTANVGYGEVLRGTALTKAYLMGRLGMLLPGAEPTGLRAHHLPLSTRRPAPARGPVLLAGDALSLINPFTGEGIFYAVLSGALAGAAAAAGPERAAACYRAALRDRLGRHLRHSGFAALLTRRPSVVDAAVRAARRDEAVFDRMVDLGLGDGVFDVRTIGRIGVQMLHIARPPS